MRRRSRCSTPTTCSRGCASSGVTELLPPAYDRICMHEFALSGAPMKRELGIRTLDLAKRLLDHGYHPPTVYFPLLVEEALLIEPTETETKETLDAFARGDRRDPARSARGPRDRARRALHDAGAPPRRGGAPPSSRSCARRSEAPRRSPVACRACGSSPASSRPGASTSATTSARSSSTSPDRTAARRSTASSTCTR